MGGRVMATINTGVDIDFIVQNVANPFVIVQIKEITAEQ